MQTTAVILHGARELGLEALDLIAPGAEDLVVRVDHSGISTGTEKLFWSGTMPPFPGMGYPLVPGYEAAGEVVEAGPDSGFRVGETVFVPGANCFAGNVRGLFGGASRHLVTRAARVARIDPEMAALEENIATLENLFAAPCLGVLPWNPAATAAERGALLRLPE